MSQLPSVQDATQLSFRIYHPPDFDPKAFRCAVFGHPYAPLGGSFDDPVVTSVAEALRNAGYVVGTFNFRGASPSRGRTSWTGTPERSDYITFTTFLLIYLSALHKKSRQPRAGTAGPPELTISLLMGGYSYGSLVASYSLPRAPPPPGHADNWASLTSCLLCDVMGFDPAAVSLDAKNDLTTRALAFARHGSPDIYEEAVRLKLDTSCILVSPLLPPVSTAIMPSWSQSDRKTCLEGCQGLIVFGDKDVFASVGRLRRWCSGMPQKMICVKEVQGASHFWQEEGVLGKLREAVSKWASEGQKGQ